jgi:XTP/dITP diphosphohydrolase
MQIIYATTNKHKLEIAQKALTDLGITLIGQGADVHEIQAQSQEEVAIDKAAKLYQIIGKPLVAMDFGLFVEPLNGFPGIYTKDVINKIGMEGLLRLTAPYAHCPAYTERTVAYTDGTTTKVFSSRCEGEIITDARGTNGRDFDMNFYIPSLDKTIAELDMAEKSNITGQAWREFGAWYLENFNS